jgi:hypothetical protein
VTTPERVREPWTINAAIAVWAASALLAVPVAVGLPIYVGAAISGSALWLFAIRNALLRWQTLLSSLLLVLFFIPIGRYTLPAALPFSLEPYRVVVGILIVLWIGALLIDDRVRLRRTGFEGPLGLFILAALASVILNGQRISYLSLDGTVFKALSFFVSFVIVLYMVVSVVRTRSAVDRLIAFLVTCGAVVAVTAVWESRTGFNVFSHLRNPLLEPVYQAVEAPRGGRFRAYASAEHPIALSALLALLVPLALYLAQVSGRRRWWVAVAALVAGSLATVSRTGILMLAVEAIVLYSLRPFAVRRLWPAILPLLVAVHFAMPGTLGTIKDSFFPKGGLIAEQDIQHSRDSGRLGDWGPSLNEISRQPLFGVGFGTRITSGPKTNTRILDDQWLATLVSTGFVGLIAWSWLFWRASRRLIRRAHEDMGPSGWLAGTLGAAVIGFGIGMWTYDAFSFTQVTLVFFILLGIATIALGRPRPPATDEAAT